MIFAFFGFKSNLFLFSSILILQTIPSLLEIDTDNSY